MSFAPGPSLLGIKKIDLRDDTTVSSGGGTNSQKLTPPTGQIYRVINLHVRISDPSGSSTGTHALNITNDDTETGHITYIRVVSTSGTDLYINDYGFSGDSAEVPSAAADQYKIMRDGVIWASQDQDVECIYVNNTDVDQTATRVIEIWAAVYKDML